MSRISFGVQTFDENIRKKLLLKPSLKDIHQLVEWFDELHFPNYTFDLMYNLPDQTMDSLAADLEQAVSLNPHYLDFFNLNIYPNTRFYKTVYEKKVFQLKPSKTNEYNMVKYIRDYMNSAGYNHACSVTYSKTEQEAHFGLKQFLQGSDMLGIGASARSFLYNKPYRNVCSVEEYIAVLGENRLPVETGLSLQEEEIATRRFVLFPTLLKIRQEDIPDRRAFHDKIEILTASGYLETAGEYVQLTDEGRNWVGNIQKFLYEDKWRQAEFSTFLASVKAGKSAYNQDYMGISKRAEQLGEG
ncbi:Oxygen-independent coproporphyrinogen-III oxidase 1 [compost metagenome]